MEDTSEDRGTDPVLELNSLFIGTITNPDTKSAWFVNASINGAQVCFKLDTGAEANVLPSSVLSKLKISKPLEKTNVVLTSYGNFKVQPEGKVDLLCVINGGSEIMPFFVVTAPSTPILGLQVCDKLNLVKKVDQVAPSFPTKESIIRDYPEVFEGFGSMDGEYHIALDETIKPVIHPPRKVPYSIQGKLKEKHSQLEV